MYQSILMFYTILTYHTISTELLSTGGIINVTSDNAIFLRGVGMFDLYFLSCFYSKLGSFCTHWKGKILNFLKLTLLLSLAHFQGPLQPVKRKSSFFWDTLFI